ncbi:RNA-directed DNA polymerase from mobile element jockey-like [Plakobranchus ocellatus]|uniref:RNA-directed DNA polymerase from mobile element jockey-like n=1 Tax=Plakobranchus ocellatus TaxID=259542 RepID=A0AAV4BDV5_9GAST|nr:RNA-directed DNA polymerase from mobile element jockey-like [Plakobranchus ocellatus]
MSYYTSLQEQARLSSIYANFIRPALEYANPELDLASRASQEKLVKVQNAALRLILGALRSTPIMILELASGCEPRSLRIGRGRATLRNYLHLLPGFIANFGCIRQGRNGRSGVVSGPTAEIGGVRNMVQWLPSHVGVISNEITDRLANEGRAQPQPQQPSTLSNVRSVPRPGTAKLLSAAQLSNGERLPKFHEAANSR